MNLTFSYGRERPSLKRGEEGEGRGSSGPVKKKIKFVLKLNFCSRVQESLGEGKGKFDQIRIKFECKIGAKRKVRKRNSDPSFKS